MHTSETKVSVTKSPASETGALDGFKATCALCGGSAVFSIKSMTDKWARDHVSLMMQWKK